MLTSNANLWRTMTYYRRKTAQQNIDTASYRADDALQLAPVTAAVSLLARAAATSEVVVERWTSDGYWARVADNLPAWADPDRQPNPWQSRPVYMWNLVANLLVNGNGISAVQTRTWNGGWPDQIVSVPFQITSVYVDGAQVSQTDVMTSGNLGLPGYGGQIRDIRYQVDGRIQLRPLTTLDSSGDVLHIRWMTKDDLVFGWSPLHWSAPPMRTAIAADAQAELAFNHPMPPGVMFNKGKIGQEKAQEADRYWRNVVRNPDKIHQPLFLSGDWSFISTYMDPNQVQLLETRRFTYDLVASLYGIPAALLSAPDVSVAGSAIRSLQRGWTMGTVVPMLNMLGVEHSALLPRGYRVRYKPAHMLELEPLEQSRVDERYAKIGVIRRSEIRSELGLPPIDGLDDEPWPSGMGGDGGDSDSGKDEPVMDEMPTGVDN